MAEQKKGSAYISEESLNSTAVLPESLKKCERTPERIPPFIQQ